MGPMMSKNILAKFMICILSVLSIAAHAKLVSESNKVIEISVNKNTLDPIDLAKKMTFHEVKPGKFRMHYSHVDTEITQPFEMMATEVTQMMWARLKIAMGEKNLNKINPSYFKTGTDSRTVSIEGIDVEMKPNHPVEQVSYVDIQEFIDGLNRLSNSSDAKTQELLIKLMPGHKKGDHYDLPTQAQWMFVRLDRGHATKTYFDRDDQAELPNYAWFEINSGDQTHAVATLLPRLIDGKPFYDLEGNVSEWNKDWRDNWHEGRVEIGKDPQGPPVGDFRIYRGGHWNINAWYTSVWQLNCSWCNTAYEPQVSNLTLGFRLLRTRL